MSLSPWFLTSRYFPLVNSVLLFSGGSGGPPSKPLAQSRPFKQGGFIANELVKQTNGIPYRPKPPIDQAPYR